MAYSKELLYGLYEKMLQIRMSEEKLAEIYALGRVPGHIHCGVGEEAPYAGTFAASRQGDYYKITHRPVSATRLAGIPFRKMFAEILGKEAGTSGARGGVNHICELEKGLMGTAGSLGCDMAVSIGAGLSAQYLGNERIVYTYYGDGTSSRGSLHEALNLAAAWKLPVLFVCTDNQFAISTHESETIPVENPGADRASAYNIPGKVADGTDVLAVYDAARELTDYVREGKGPAILETKCYRWRGHFEGDQAKYRDEKTAEEMRRKCCIRRLEQYMLDNKVMTQSEMDEIRAGIALELEDALAFAEAAPEPNREDIFKNLYVE